MTKILQRVVLLTFFYLVSTSSIYAGTEPYENFIKGSIKKGDSIIVKDEKFRNKEYKWSDITNISVNNALKLQILDDKPLSKNFSCKLMLRVEYFSDPEQKDALVIDTVKLDVNYSADKQVAYKLSDVYRFKGAYLVKVYVTDIKSAEYGSQLPPVLQLTSYITIDRKYRFDATRSLRAKARIIAGKKGGSGTKDGGSSSDMETQSISMLSIAAVSQSPTGNQIELTWPPLPGAEEYDIEWTTADIGSAAGVTAAAMVANNTVPEDDLKKLFRNNATRITTSKEKYLLSMVFNNDFLVARMRGVHYDAVSGLRIEGDWDYRQDDSPYPYSAWPISLWHQENLNWQYSSAFAEEGKKKEVITYFDGSLRAKQTVTLSNTDIVAPEQNIAVVQENVYDQFGRPVASILPAPVKDPASAIQYLHYFPNLNLNGTSPYRFTNIINNGCDIVPAPLSNTSGAGRYYSGSNSFINDNLFNKYIPDAEGYPLSVTQYTADNTGRIKQQGGVGKTFQPGLPDGGKVTKYYYGKPEQWELDKIFGNDAGYASHYLKNIVVDPNNQISVSYLNASGKTVATALAGLKPQSMDALETPALEKEENIKLLQPTQFKFDGSSLKLSATTTYMASVTGQVTLNYDIERIVRNYSGEEFNACSNCYYDLSISIRDDCNTLIYKTEQPVKIGPESATCGLNAQLQPIVRNFDKIGEYYITFEFALSKNVIEAFTNEFLSKAKANGTVKKEAEFILKYLNKAPIQGCFADCRTTVKDLGSQQAFTAMFTQQLTDLGAEEIGQYSSYISGLYTSLLNTANSLQASCNLSPCDMYRKPMLDDVSPGGTYANPDEPELNVLAIWFKNGVFNNLTSADPLYQATVITLENGQEISPYDANFSLSDLINYWKPEWAELFLPKHPEYCKLQFCEQNSGSYNWDEKLKQIYTRAVDIPQVGAGAQYSRTNGAWLLAHDPFFVANTADYNNMQSELQNYSSSALNMNAITGASSSELVNKNLSEFVDYQIYCADKQGGTNQLATDPNTWNNCVAVEACRVPDREWEMYVNIYLELKEKYYDQRRKATTCANACQVGTPYSVQPTTGGNTGCAFGEGGTLTLNSNGEQLAINQFRETNFYSSSNQTVTYTMVEGTAGSPPDESTYCSTGTVSKSFYGCYKVILPDGQIRQFFNVWVISCTESFSTGCNSAGYLSVNGSYEYGNSFYVDRYYNERDVYRIASSVNPPNTNYCSNSSWIFYCAFNVHDYNSGQYFTFENVWVQVCRETYYGGYYMASDSETMSVGTMAMKSNLLDPLNKKAAERYKTIEQSLEKDETLLADYTYRKIYLVKRVPEAGKNQTTSPLKTKRGFGDYQFREYFAVRDGKKSHRILRNVWVAEFIPDEGSRVAKENKVREESGMMQIQSVSGAPAFSGCVSHYGAGIVQYADETPDNRTKIQVTLSGPVCSTKSLYPAILLHDGTDWRFHMVVEILPGQTTGFGYISASEYPLPHYIQVCGTVDCTGGSTGGGTGGTGGTLTCPASLLSKKSHFPEVGLTDVSGIDMATYGSDVKNDANAYITTSCNATADLALERLADGLAAYSEGQKEMLRAGIAALCSAAGDVEHPMGASSLPNGIIYVNNIGCSNFGDVIKAALGLQNFTPTLNPWLIEAPYPYNVKQQAAEQIISNSSPELCGRLNTLKQEYQSAPGAANSFYHWLQLKYGSAMQLKPEELTILETSCGQCKYLLSADIKLPLFLDPKVGSNDICRTSQQYNTELALMNSTFSGTLSSSHYNYETIVANYMNGKWGFSSHYEKYKALGENASGVLCKDSPYTAAEADPYACVRSLIEQAVGSGAQEYKAYIDEEKRKYWNAYVNACSKAKTYVDLKAKQQVYHYTLYYYDQADNLVRTVPPEGVTFLSDAEIERVGRARKFDATTCNYNGPLSNSDEAIALTSLKDEIEATAINNSPAALEFWTYNEIGTGAQVMVTANMKYMVQVCLTGSKLSADIYSLTQESSGSVTITRSNHISGNTGSIALAPWNHVVMQCTNLATGNLQIYVNGQPVSAVSESTAGCGWEITTNPLVMPRYMNNLKHLRIYSRLMSSQEIATNAADACLAISNGTNLGSRWYRFNAPNAGGPTTIAENSTVETQNNDVFPAHGLPTSYVYNSTNQVIQQKTPDGGINRFWYDMLSRLVVSQNAKQRGPANDVNDYSYTTYDVLGRVVEVGQKDYTTSILTDPSYLDIAGYQSFLSGGSNSQITQTLYDAPAAGNGVPTGMTQDNLRKRVAASIYRETPASTNINASYYNYDIAGNVKRLYQQVDGLYKQADNTGLKHIDYEYDLVSGKVNFVAYQHGQNDQFYYQYDYDSENRLTKAWSSTVATVDQFGLRSHMNEADRKLDASYQYYLHGPLARMELGDEGYKVQGMDYAYTLQGWLKGVNGNALNQASDINNDGSSIAKDAIAYSLGYYQNDYTPIGGITTTAFNMKFTPDGGAGKNLYNGNISNSTVAIQGINSGNTSGYSYGYDQLNRLKEFRQHALSSNTTTWNSSSINSNGSYAESFRYDGNGNILNVNRTGNSGAMDNLSYGYNKDATGKLINNRLRHVKDAVGAGAYNEDIDNQNDDNYSYDAIGNLIADSQEGITSIDWTVYGKIKSIAKNSGTISYQYDPSGNRVSKTANGLTTWYLRDAQGNSLAVYDNANSSTNWKEQQLYGSSRLGMWKPEINIASTSGTAVWSLSGKKAYELSNHLGNVLAVISDKRMLNSSKVYEADVVSASDYTPFGMAMVGRTYTAPSSNYRYSFNGKEDDKDAGSGMQDYGMRIYDARLGRFLSEDPITKKYPELTPYQFASNTPIQAIDIDGLEAFYVHGTWSSPSTYPKVTITTVNEIFGNTKGKDFSWSGANSDQARRLAARQLANHIMKYRDPNQPLTIVGHSHGGNVGIMAANILFEEYHIKVNNLLTINTPVREYKLNVPIPIKHYQVFHKGDPVQGNGGNSSIVPDAVVPLPRGGLMPIYAGGLRFPSGETGKAGRTFDTAINIEVEGFNGTLPGSLMRFHDSHQRPYLWSQKLRNASNGQFNSLPINAATEPVKQDNIRVAPSNIKPTP